MPHRDPNDPRVLPEVTHVGDLPPAVADLEHAHRDDKGELRSPSANKPSAVSHPHEIHPDTSSTDGEPQRGSLRSTDSRKLPTTEHVEGDVSTRVNEGLPADKTDVEKRAESKGEHEAQRKGKPIDPSLKRPK